MRLNDEIFLQKRIRLLYFFKNDRQILTQKKFPLLAQCENHSKKSYNRFQTKKNHHIQF